MSPSAPVSSLDTPNATSAVAEAKEIFVILQQALQIHGATAKDVMMVHLYLSEISLFGSINAHYRDFFGSVLPPSRSCIAVGKNVLPGGRRVLLDCMVQCGSGDYMRGGVTATHSNTSGSMYAESALATTATEKTDNLLQSRKS